MTKDPAFLFYPGDYLQDTQCLSESTQVAYDRIMCEHMRNICISKQQLNFFTKRLTDEERNELLMMLTKKPEGYQITWVAESIEKRRLYSESRRDNRKSTSKEKPKKGNNISLSYDEHMVNENENEVKEEKENEILIWPTFEDFWNEYNKKVGNKEKIEKKWDKITQNDKELIMKYLPDYRKAQPDKKYRKHPETFLNNKSWNDELIYDNGKQKSNETLASQAERIFARIDKEGN